jgi:spore germination protein
MKKKWAFPMVSAILAISLLIAGIWGFQQARAHQQLAIKVENQYQRAFQEFVNNVQQMSVNTGKALVSGTRLQTVTNLTDIWRQSYIAQSNLGQLPLSRLVLERTSKFLTQFGDFAFILAKHQTEGEGFTKEEVSQLKSLKDQIDFLSAEMKEFSQKVNKEGFSWEELDRQLAKRMEKADNLAVKNLRTIEKAMVDYPTLVYDGPFADTVINRKPLGNLGQSITKEDALKRAREFLGAERIRGYNGEYAGRTGGVIPAYSIMFTPANGSTRNRIYLDVSQKGGHIIWMIDERTTGEAVVSSREARAAAEEFLRTRGYKDMVITSEIIYEDVVAYSFGYLDKDIIVYPDLIKIEIALDDGDVIGFEAREYLMAHRERTYPQPEITMEEARKQVAERIEIDRERLTLIPLPTGKEVLCYEFKGRALGEEYLVYINVVTGEEEQILRVVRTEQGVLSL